MIAFRESRANGYHNYLVNDMLTPGFLVGNPHSPRDFFFLADVLSPEECVPLISGRLMDEKGSLLAELKSNHLADNPGQCLFQSTQVGFRITDPSGGAVCEIRTHQFTNGFLTYIKAKLYDEQGTLRIEPLGESIQVYGEANLVLDRPLGGSALQC